MSISGVNGKVFRANRRISLSFPEATTQRYKTKVITKAITDFKINQPTNLFNTWAGNLMVTLP